MSLRTNDFTFPSSHFNTIAWNDEQHLLKIAHITVSFTATEYRIITSLKQGHQTSYTTLARSIYNRKLDRKGRTMIDKHVERMRGKLRGTGIYIYCVLNYGYILLPELPLNAPAKC